jgi:hypothetical protein
MRNILQVQGKLEIARRLTRVRRTNDSRPVTPKACLTLTCPEAGGGVIYDWTLTMQAKHVLSD